VLNYLAIKMYLLLNRTPHFEDLLREWW